MKFLPPLISWEVCQTISPKELTNKNAEIILHHSLINPKSTPFKGVLGYRIQFIVFELLSLLLSLKTNISPEN